MMLLMGAILILFLSTLSLRRATSIKPIFGKIDTNFYPRSPCGERLGRAQGRWQPDGFLSTLSLRRATGQEANNQPGQQISIHALLAESDASTTITITCIVSFLSTLSLRRATVHYDNYNLHCVISIHALLAESDFQAADIS